MKNIFAPNARKKKGFYGWKRNRLKIKNVPAGNAKALNIPGNKLKETPAGPAGLPTAESAGPSFTGCRV